MYLKLYQVFYASSHVKLVKRAVVSSTALFKSAFSHKRFFAYAYVQA